MSSTSILNPAHTLQSQELYLDSKYATVNYNSPANSDVVFYFDNPIYCPSSFNIVLKFINASVPLSFYNINQYNNTFNTSVGNFVMTNGNYNALQLEAHLNVLLAGVGITCDFNEITNQFTFTRANAWTYLGTSTSQTILGFTAGNQVAVNIAGTWTLTSTNCCDLTYTKNVYVDIDNIVSNNLMSVNGGFTPVMKSIPIDLSQGSILTFVDSGETSLKLKENFISYLHIRLLDDNLNTLNLNGLHFSLTFELYFVNNGQTNITNFSQSEIDNKLLDTQRKLGLSTETLQRRIVKRK